MQKTGIFGVLTFQSKEDIIATGKIWDWGVKKERVEKFKYIMCSRNANAGVNSLMDVPHRTAFLVGKIKNIELTGKKTGSGVERIMVVISEYAEVNAPNAWSNSRNPAGFFYAEDFGINVSELDFKPVKGEKPEWSLDFAKQQIADHYKVPVSSVRVSIDV